MKTITIDNVEYQLTPVEKSTWTKHDVPAKKLEWGLVADKAITWEKAEKWCEEQGGRLPTAIELLQAYTDKVDGFTPADYFWTATTYPNSGSQYNAIVVNWSFGNVNVSHKTNGYRVRCVRG